MERLTAWVEAYRWKALAGLAAVLSLFVFVTSLIPHASSAYGRYRTWRQQQAKLASVANWEAQYLQLSTKKRLLQQRFATLYVSLPRSDHMSIILQVLQESADTAQVDLKHVRPTERISFAHHDALPFQVELAGAFHALGTFTSRIEQSPYVIKVEQLRFQRAASSPETLMAELVLSVIILKEQGAGT